METLVGYYYQGVVVCTECASAEEKKYGEKIFAGSASADDICCICGVELWWM